MTDFVIVNDRFQVLAIIELDDPSHIGQEQRDAEHDEMLHDAGYIVLRYTQIPTLQQLRKDLKNRVVF